MAMQQEGRGREMGSGRRGDASVMMGLEGGRGKRDRSAGREGGAGGEGIGAEERRCVRCLP